MFIDVPLVLWYNKIVINLTNIAETVPNVCAIKK